MMTKKVFALCVASFFACGLFAQTITTASDYFKTVSEHYSKINTYEVDVDMSLGSREMYGHISFKRPDLLRIDFSEPQEQVIVYNGQVLTIYLPDTSSVLQQIVQGDSSGANLATPQGLSLMSRYYTVAYETGREPVKINGVADEQVVNLILMRRNATEAFRTIKLSIGADSNLIRRVEAFTTGGETFVFLYSSYSINGDITDQRFIYDPPSSANIYNNFLFSE